MTSHFSSCSASPSRSHSMAHLLPFMHPVFSPPGIFSYILTLHIAKFSDKPKDFARRLPNPPQSLSESKSILPSYYNHSHSLPPLSPQNESAFLPFPKAVLIPIPSVSYKPHENKPFHICIYKKRIPSAGTLSNAAILPLSYSNNSGCRFFVFVPEQLCQIRIPYIIFHRGVCHHVLHLIIIHHADIPAA